MQIKPQQPFPIVRQLGDPTDTNTNYVQAVVRDSLFGTVLAKIDLNDDGAQRFEANYLVPADVSGMGLYIDITTTVYTDSEYSVVNPNYEIVNACYLALQPLTIGMGLGGGNGGGVEIDYKKIAAIINDIKFPKQKKIVFEPLFRSLRKEILSRLRVIEDREIDFMPVVNHIAQVGKLVKEIKIPTPKDPEKVDLMPVLEGLQNLAESLGKIDDSFDGKFKSVQDFLDGRDVDVTGQLKNFLDGIPEETSKALSGILMFGSSMKKSKTEKKIEPKQVDPRVSKLFE